MIRAKDLAAKLGVSAATVSLVLNDKPGICDDTRRELRKRIVDMGYGYMLKTPESGMADVATPRKSAMPNLRAEKGKIAFVIYPVCKECGDTSSFYTQVMEGASAYLQEKGYEMMVYHVKPECGCTLADLVKEKKLAIAKILLKNTDMKVSEIATQVNVGTENYFYMLFSQKYGLSPLQYRKKKRGLE